MTVSNLNDLWTFSVFVPDTTDDDPNTSTGDNANNKTSPSTATTKKTKVVQLRRAPDENDTCNIKTAAVIVPVSEAVEAATTGIESTGVEIMEGTPGVTDERTSLLTASGSDRASSTPTTPPINPTGWTFGSPYWTLQSSILLKMVYQPAWQRLPAYTNAQCCNSNNSSMLGTVGSFTKAAVHGCCCCSSCKRKDPFHSMTLTTQDIHHVESIPNLDVRGVGECSAIRLYLTYPKGVFDELEDVPEQYRENWDQQVEHAQDNANNKNNQQPGDNNDNANFLRSMKTEVDNDFTTGDSLSPTAHRSGPTITFAMPKDTAHDDDEPPLLWKVEVPPPSSDNSNSNGDSAVPIALETLTILDGPLVVTPTTTQPQKQQQSHRPTHMFINGFQSWSFAGSVPLGKPQPQPAMPDLFSKAFNHGATVPPVSLEYVPLGRQPPKTSRANNDSKPYLSDFFTCITSHEDEEDDDEASSDNAAAAATDDPAATDGNNRRERFRPRKVVHRALDERGGPALALGWLSQRYQFGIISVDPDVQRIEMHASHQGQLLLPNNDDDGNSAAAAAAATNSMIQTDWAFAQLEAPHTYDEEPLVHYLRAVAGYNQAKPLQNGPLLTGWCSWYHYYENIDEESLKSNFSKLSKLRKTCPTNVSVVDDGYMTAWGDWDSLKPGKFSSTNSMKAVADNIRDEKMRPGIWLAPFTCDKHSKLAQAHPDWIIRNEQGIPANSSNCGKFFYGLDATNPQVLEYVYKCIRRAVEEWGYTVLKIDFLYAACLDGNGKHDNSLSRAQAMHLAMHTIRSAAGPDTFLIGCGCPLGSGIGYVDGMRISADTGPTWYPAFPLPSWDHGTLPSLRGMIRNSITRAPMGHRWWHNDPDCLMLGSTTRLTDEEVASSASVIALTCGMLLLSDDLTQVSPARMRILTKIFPMTGVSAVVLDMHSLQDPHGLPSMLRLWCTDATQKREDFRKNSVGALMSSSKAADDKDHNEEAGFFSSFATFRSGKVQVHPSERQRSCIHMVKGLGTWTVLSVSNWLDRAAVVHIPPLALAPPPEASAADSLQRGPINPEHGYHVFAFWSSKYYWISGTPDHPDAIDTDGTSGLPGPISTSDRPLLSKLLGPHETEVFHIKPVTPNNPQYLGSDIHFSCGQEVEIFSSNSKNRLSIQLRTEYHRIGFIFVFVPVTNTSHVKTMCGGEPCRWTVVGNTPQNTNCDQRNRGPSTVLGRVLQVAVSSHGDGRNQDGSIVVEF